MATREAHELTHHLLRCTSWSSLSLLLQIEKALSRTERSLAKHCTLSSFSMVVSKPFVMIQVLLLRSTILEGGDYLETSRKYCLQLKGKTTSSRSQQLCTLSSMCRLGNWS
ncbi:uncharacterized protein [Nicotiana sylvestris]|uniref:uncharacterized protein isoform X1 n=1 Tax=Nicotiana sylvestris TaxID=4096 RepID=UPI00388C4CC4